jgi:hypothetical protein
MAFLATVFDVMILDSRDGKEITFLRGMLFPILESKN